MTAGAILTPHEAQTREILGALAGAGISRGMEPEEARDYALHTLRLIDEWLGLAKPRKDGER